MAKKPPSQLQRIIMAADPKKAKEAIEFIKKQVAQGGGTPEQKKLIAEIDKLKTDADKLAAYVTAKEEGRLEYDYKPQKGDVPRAAQEPWTKRDQRFYEGKAAEPETPKQTKSKKGSKSKPKTTQAQADEAALGKMAGKPTVTKAPEVSEPVATDPRAKALGISDTELDKRLELARKIASGETPVEAAPTVEATPKAAEPEAPKETKSKGFKKTKEATAKSKTPKPVVVKDASSASAPKTSVVEPTPSVASEPRLPEGPTVEEAEAQAKSIRERITQQAPKTEPTVTEPTSAPKSTSRTTMDADVAYQMTPEGQLYRTGSEAPKPPVTTSRSAKYQVSPEGSLSGPGIIGDKIKSISGNVFMDSAPQQSSLPLDQSTRFGAGINEPDFITARGSSAGGEAGLTRPLGDEGIDLSRTGATETPKSVRYNVTPEGGITPASEGFQPESIRSSPRYSLAGEGATPPPTSPKSSGFSLSPEGIQSGFKWAGRGLAALDVARNIQEGDVAGALVSGGLSAAPEVIGAVAGGAAGAGAGLAAGVLYPTKSAVDAGEEGINNLLKLYNTAKTPEEKATLKEVINRTRRLAMGASEEEAYAGKRKADREIIATTPDEQMIKEAQTYTRPKQLVESEKKAAKGLRSDDLIADFIGQAESRGNYKAVNKNSGAFGKYQILEKDLNGKDVHGKMVESRYGEPFKQAMADPEKQEDYFRNVLLPNYKIKAAELAKTPEAQEMGLDEFTLIGMLQLGAGNVRKYLAGNANENISKQMEYFKDKADKYKRSIGDEQAAILGLKDKEQQIQEEGRYIPYKSAQAKIDTARLGQVINRKDMDDLNARSEMYQTYQKADPFVSRMSPSQRRLQESETLTSDSFTPEQIRAAAVSDSDEVPTQEQATAKLATAPTEQVKAAVEEPITTAEPTIAPTRQRSRLEEALELQRQYEMMAGISRGAERLGRGLAGAISKVAPSKMSGGEFEESLTRMGKTGVEGAKLLDEEAIKQEESDPMSEKSKRARESLKSILGTDLPESLSYNDIKTLKFSDLSLKTGAAKTQQEKTNTQRIDKLGKSLIAELQSRQQFGIDAKTLANVQNAEALLTGYKSLDDIPQAQIYEVARAVDRIVSQASPTISASKELTPETARSVLSKYISFASGRVTGAGVGEFLKNYRKLLDREKVQAQSRIKSVQKRIAAPYLDLWENPEYKNRIRYIFEANGLDADSMFETIEPNKQEEKEQLKPKIHPQSGIELYD